MSRIKIELPDKFLFTTEIPIRVSDINYGGHLGNDSVLSIAQEARIRFLNQFGFSEMDVAGVGIIMIDAVVNYMSQGFYGDVLIIELAVTELSRIGCDIVYRMTNKKSGEIIAVLKTGIAFYDYQQNKVTGVPSKFKEVIASHWQCHINFH